MSVPNPFAQGLSSRAFVYGYLHMTQVDNKQRTQILAGISGGCRPPPPPGNTCNIQERVRPGVDTCPVLSLPRRALVLLEMCYSPHTDLGVLIRANRAASDITTKAGGTARNDSATRFIGKVPA